MGNGSRHRYANETGTLVRMVKVKTFVPKPVGSENKQDVTKELSI